MNRRAFAIMGSVVAVVLLSSQPAWTQNTVTQLLRSGSAGTKKNLVIVGDGFAAGADQTTFNNFVTTLVMDGLFASGRHFNEDMNVFNIFRINAISQDSGVTLLSHDCRCPNCNHIQPWGTTDTTYPYEDTCQLCGTPMQVVVTTARNTALDYRYSGVWGRCWMEPGPNFQTNFNTIVGGLVPQYDYVIVVLNTTQGGGCGGSGRIFVTLSSGWTTIAHELGHAIGNLADEYFSAGTYTGGEPTAVDATINLNPLKWAEFVNPSTAIPTTWTASMDPQTTGAFEGAVYCSNGIYRPCNNCTMRNGTSFCPVCYTHMKETLDPFHQYTFLKSYRGDFNGDGRQDLLIHNANSLTIYSSTGTELQILWSVTGDLPGWDDIKPGDQFYIGDFNGDGLDDAYVFNSADWRYPYLGMLKSNGANGLQCIRLYELELPGWDDMKSHDRFFVADFNRDKKDDLYVFNGEDWGVGYLVMLKSTGTALQCIRRYDEELPGWDDMKKNDLFYVADLNYDRREDLYVFNGRDWSMGYLEMLRSTGTALQCVRRYDAELPGWDDMKKNDLFYVADFNHDRKKDLYVFNGKDWAMEYLGMLRSTGTELQMVRRFNGSIPGWGAMAPNDEFYVADLNGDKKDDLYVYNADDWSTEYLGLLQSLGNTLQCVLTHSDWIGRWNLGTVDRFITGDFSGDGLDDVFIRNSDWLGLLRSQTKILRQIALYRLWIHNIPYHQYGWW